MSHVESLIFCATVISRRFLKAKRASFIQQPGIFCFSPSPSGYLKACPVHFIGDALADETKSERGSIA
jgi:hypothetical protein